MKVLFKKSVDINVVISVCVDLHPSFTLLTAFHRVEKVGKALLDVLQRGDVIPEYYPVPNISNSVTINVPIVSAHDFSGNVFMLDSFLKHGNL